MNRGHAGHAEFEVFGGLRFDLPGRVEDLWCVVWVGAVVGSASLREGAAAAVGVGVASTAKDVVPMPISIDICIRNRGVRIFDLRCARPRVQARVQTAGLRKGLQRSS